MKAQAAVELIIILAIALVVFIYIFEYSSQATISSDSQLRFAQAEATGRDIVQAAEMLYAEGEGARTRLYLTIPEMIEGTTVSDKTINTKVYVSGKINDVPVNSKVSLCGDLPDTSGGHWVTLTMRDNCVHIGGDVLDTDTARATFSLFPGNYSNSSVEVTNNGENTINVNITIDSGDIPGTVTLSTVPELISSLSSEASSDFVVEVTVGSSTDAGAYTGSILLTALAGTDIVDTLTLTLELTVSAAVGGGGSSIIIFPGSWDFGSAEDGETDSKAFSICNNGDSQESVDANLSSTYLSFASSSTITGVPITLASESCNDTITAYLDSTSAPAANYSETLTATGSDSDTSTVTFEVWTTPAVDSTQPTVSLTSVNATLIDINDLVCINATATDETALDSVWAALTNPAGTQANYSMSAATCGSGAGRYGVAVQLSTAGNWTLNTSFANDTSNNIGFQSPYPNTQIDVTPAPAGPTESSQVPDIAVEDDSKGAPIVTTEVSTSNDVRSYLWLYSKSSTYVYLYANYSFSIPGGSTINSVTSNLEHYESDSCVENELEWYDGAAWQNVCTVPYSAADTWGSCAHSDIDTVGETSLIQVRMAHKCTSENNRFAYMDMMNITINYTE